MVPETAATFGVFLLLVAPGIVFQLLRAGSRPEAKSSAFRETSVVALTSLLFSAVAVASLAALRAFRPAWMPDPGAWLRDGAAYVEMQYRLVALAALIELVIAVAVAYLVHRLLDAASDDKQLAGRAERLLYGRERRVRSTSAWFQVFRTARRRDERVYVSVETTGGDVYSGFVTSYTAEDEGPADRELVLGPPIALRRDGEEQQLDDWHRLILPGAAIAAVLVAYAEDDAAT